MRTLHTNYFLLFLMMIIMTPILFIKCCSHYSSIIWKSVILTLPSFFIFLMHVVGSIGIVKSSTTYAIILIILEWMQSAYFWQQAMKNHHVMVLVDSLRGLLPREPCSNQWIIKFWIMIDLCVEEIKDIHFVLISQEEMQIIQASLKSVLMLQKPFQVQSYCIS